MRKANYSHLRKQKETVRKARHEAREQRRSARRIAAAEIQNVAQDAPPDPGDTVARTAHPQAHPG